MRTATESDLERPLPHNLDAERSVLGAVLLDNHALQAAIEKLKPDDFLLDQHRRVFRHMVKMRDAGTAIDLVTLVEELDRNGELEAAGSAAYLAKLVDGVPRIANVAEYCRIVKEKSFQRDLIRQAHAIEEAAFEGKESPHEIARCGAEILSAAYRNGVPAERILPTLTGAQITSLNCSNPLPIVGGLIFRGSLSELSGKPKLSGKTSFSLGMASCILSGRDFIGMPTRRTPVVFLTEESPLTFRAGMERFGLLGNTDLHVCFWRDVRGMEWETLVRLCV